MWYKFETSDCLNMFFVFMLSLTSGRRMVSALDSGSSDPGSGPGWGHCVVFLGTLSPPRCINGYRRNAGGNPAMD